MRKQLLVAVYLSFFSKHLSDALIILGPKGASVHAKTQKQIRNSVNMVAGIVGRKNVEQVAGSDVDGLLDTSRMERASNGPGVTVPQSQKLKIAVIGAGLGGMITAMDLSEAGHNVEIFEARRFVGGKESVGSWVDKDRNHIEMGLHVFFGCYYNLFGIFRRLGIFESSLRLKDHRHIFINEGGSTGELDFRMGGIGAPINGIKAFLTTEQLGIMDKFANAVALATSPVVKALFDFDAAMNDVRNLDSISFSQWFQRQGGSRGSIERLWDPIAYALGFIDCDHISARCMLTIFQLFAVRSEASVLRMLEGSPEDYIHKPIMKYLAERNVNINTNCRVVDIIHKKDEKTGKPILVKGIVTSGASVGSQDSLEFDVVVAATDVPGIKKLLPDSFRNSYPFFENIYKLDGVPVSTVQLRFDGWVTELNDEKKMKDIKSDYSDGKAPGIDNLLYSADVEFSCFADLALTSPSSNYYQEGKGSLLQCVMTPGDKWMPISTEKIADACLAQVRRLFPSSRGLNCTWSHVVKLGESLYREAPGMDKYRPSQRTPIANFFMAGSYTYQDYIDSMEGATKSALLCADCILEDTPKLVALRDKEKSVASTNE